MATTEAGTPWANPGPETVLFSGRRIRSPTVTTLAALDTFDRADIGALEIVAGHACNVVIEAADIAEGLDRLRGAEAIAALLEDRVANLPEDLAARGEIFLSVQPKFSQQFACAGLAVTTAERALKATESKLDAHGGSLLLIPALLCRAG